MNDPSPATTGPEFTVDSTTVSDGAVWATPPQRRPHKLIVRAVSIAFAGVIVTVSAIALTNDEPQSASTGTPRAASTAVAVPMSPDAAEHWFAPDSIDVRGMSPDAVEHWLAPQAAEVRGMSPDAAEHWLADE